MRGRTGAFRRCAARRKGQAAGVVQADKTYVEAAVGAPAMTSQLSKEEMLNLKSGGSKQYFKVRPLRAV